MTEILQLTILFQLFYIGWQAKDIVIELRWSNRMKEKELKHNKILNNE